MGHQGSKGGGRIVLAVGSDRRTQFPDQVPQGEIVGGGGEFRISRYWIHPHHRITCQNRLHSFTGKSIQNLSRRTAFRIQCGPTPAICVDVEHGRWP
jgi:hypothetical protein